eukprot:1538920-Pyramimonas_sp.AAC.1
MDDAAPRVKRTLEEGVGTSTAASSASRPIALSTGDARSSPENAEPSLGEGSLEGQRSEPHAPRLTGPERPL